MPIYNTKTKVLFDETNPSIKANHHQLLMKNIQLSYKLTELIGSGVCHDAAAFMHFLAKPFLSANDKILIQSKKTSKEWINYFYSNNNFTVWDGVSVLPIGKVIGFHCPLNTYSHLGVFHSAYSIGNNKVRGINGNKLGNGWSSVDLTKEITINSDGTMSYDTYPVVVYISNR